MCIFFATYHRVNYPSYEIHIFNKKLRNRKFQFWWLRHKVWCWEFLTNSVNFDNICFVILEKKPFLSGVIVSVKRRRKSIKVTFVSFGLQTGRLTVECTDYRRRYFVILNIFYPIQMLLWIQRLQSISSVTEACSFTSALPILIWLSLEKIDKKNFSSNPCFQPNQHRSNLFAFK